MATVVLNPVRLALARVVDMLMPPTCAGCKLPVAGSGYCAACFAGLQEIGGVCCGRCGIPLPVEHQNDAECLECRRQAPAWDRAVAAYVYAGVARDSLLAFKNGREELAGLMGQAMARAGRSMLETGVVLVPVPLHRWRLWARGYNQSVLLARDVGRRAGLRVEVDLLQRAKPTQRSNGLSKRARERNVRGAFRVRPERRGELKGAHVVLVDDVLTSGATAAACARVLRRAGAARVDVLTYARVAQTDVTA